MRLIKVSESLAKPRPKRSNTETLALLLMGALFILFIPFIIELAITKSVTDKGAVFYVPGEFGLSTMVVLASSWAFTYAHRYKEKDNLFNLRYALLTVLFLGALFLCLQFLGWQRILDDSKAHNVKILLVLVAVHGVHFLIALSLVASLLIKMIRIKTSADIYIFFLTPRHHYFFKTTEQYWAFLGFLWMGLYIIMLLKTI